jgi:tRNA(Ile)-lysidine synthetase-like protein
MSRLVEAAGTVAPGPWAIGVSGGADSVALLSLLRPRSDLQLHVVHLDHQTRGSQSTEDARFVEELSGLWELACTIARRDQVERNLSDLPRNPSARYRAARMLLFQQVVDQHRLCGVILAHHADDQAQTVLQRLLRSSGPMGLAGMAARTSIGRLIIARPLLGVRRGELRDYLRETGQPWRTDPSNESPAYLRNRLRALISMSEPLFEALIDLSRQCATLRDWVHEAAPDLGTEFLIEQLAALPDLLGGESARRWLIDRGVPPDQIGPDVLARLLDMSRDAATPARQQFPGGILVRRRRGVILTDRSPGTPPAEADPVGPST